MTEPYGAAYVRILADLDQFERDLKTKMQRAVDTAGKTQKFDEFEKAAGRGGERAGGEISDGMTRELERRKPEARRAGERQGTVFGQGFVTAAKAALGRVALYGALGGAGGALIGAAAQTLPALLASLPALTTAAAAGVGVLVAALHGFGSTIAAGVGGDTQAFAEGLAKLAPNAKNVAREIVGLTGVFKQLQLDIQQQFFLPLQGGFQTLARSLIPELRAQLPKLAYDFGSIAREVLAGFSSPQAKTAIGTILGQLDEGLRPFIPLVHQMVEEFLQVGAVAAPFIADISKALAGDLGKFLHNLSESLGNGGVQKFFEVAGGFFSTFGSTLGSVLGLLTDVLSALSSAGSPLLTLIGMLADTLRTALAPALPGLSKLMTALADSFGRILVALTPALVAIFGELGSVFETIASQLPGLADALAPILADLGFMLEAYGPQISQVLGFILVQAFQLVIQVLKDVLPFFDKLLPVFVQLVTTVMPELIPYFAQLFRVLFDLLPLIPSLVGLFEDWLLVVEDLIPIMPSIIQLSTDFLKILAVILEVVVPLLAHVIDLVAWLGKIFTNYAFEPWAKSFGAVLGTVVGLVEALNKGLEDFFNKGKVGKLDRLGGNSGSGGTRPRAYALGGLVTRPTLALVGEAGVPEAVVPMGSPAQARKVARSTGLLDMLGTAGGAPTIGEIHVYIGDREVTDIVSVVVDSKFDGAADDLDSGTRGWG